MKAIIHGFKTISQSRNSLRRQFDMGQLQLGSSVLNIRRPRLRQLVPGVRQASGGVLELLIEDEHSWFTDRFSSPSVRPYLVEDVHGLTSNVINNKENDAEFIDCWLSYRYGILKDLLSWSLVIMTTLHIEASLCNEKNVVDHLLMENESPPSRHYGA